MPCPNHPEAAAGLEPCERCGDSFCPDCYVILRDAPYCATCKLELVRDLRSGIEPDGLDYGSVGRRFAALFLDNFLSTMAAYAVMIPMILVIGAASGVAGAGDDSGASDAIAGFFVLLMYPILLGIPFVYEGWMLQAKSQTVGKMALGVKVVTPSGGPISRGQAWGRAALKIVLASCVGVTYIPALVTKERTTLHDMIAGTRVVRVHR